MPYKGVESFQIEEECVKRWARDLRPSTARTYVYYFLKYLEWVKKNGFFSSAEEMLNDARKGDPETLYNHLELVFSYLKQLNVGIKDKKNRYMAIRNFYEYHRCPLPKPSKQQLNRVFYPSELDKLRALNRRPLKLEEVKKIIIHAPQPYKAAFMVVLQSGMGPAEFDIFNRYSWHSVVQHLDSEGPVKIDLIRQKTSRGVVRKYYTFIGEDAKMLIKEWLKERPTEAPKDYLFVVYNRQKKEFVPLTGRLLGNMLTKIAKRIGLIEPNGLNRYHIHLHEFRDLFKSQCTLCGVHQVASEFFLGHVIDKLGYDKSPEYDVEWFKKEYMKVEPELNILSGAGKKISEVKERLSDYEKMLEELRAENQLLKEQLNRLTEEIKVINELFAEIVKEPSMIDTLREMYKIAKEANKDQRLKQKLLEVLEKV